PDDIDLHTVVTAVDVGLQRPYVTPQSDTAFAIFVPNPAMSTFHIAIALETNVAERWTDVVIAADIPAHSPLLADATPRIVRALFTASDRFERIDPDAIEAAILDQ